MRKKWHAMDVKEVMETLSTLEEGLSQKEQEKRIEKYGQNSIEYEEENHPFLIFLKQFRSGLVYVLFVAALISFLFGKMIDVYVISAVIVLNAIMGFFQEYKAEKAIQALKKMIVPTAKVLRGGELFKIPAKDLVPGDVVEIEEGDRIPADLRLFKVKDFRTMEAALTGESTPIGKKIKKMNEETDLGDRDNMAWMGTFSVAGKARGIVVSTGGDTAFGRIAKDIGEVEKKGGHFEDKIDTLAKQMAVFAFSGAALIFLIGFLFRGIEFQEMFLFTIAALVSGIPEGLPAILVVVLAIGATRMAKRNAIIRRLPATETLGVTDHIVTDKTGTLTQNTMTVRRIIFPKGREIEVTGQGWNPEGDFYRGKKKINPLEEADLKKLLQVASICNNSRIYKEEGKYLAVGDPTEAALVVVSKKGGMEEPKEEKIDDMPFNSKLKYRASLSTLTKKEGKSLFYTVGAPEAVIKASSYIQEEGKIKKLGEAERKEMLKRVEEMSEEAMRTIALAYKEVDDTIKEVNSTMAKDLILVGVVGMMDPPRVEVKEAIAKAHRAGIRVIMTTGDHRGTAIAIAKEIGLFKEKKEDFPEAFTESELKEMNKREFKKAVTNVDIFARLTPHMKLKIAKTLQEEGAIVAMTGDGVNDAPAVRQADIGVAMGITGTDVTKEAGEIVLADDNFSSIIAAVEEGRIVFTNTRQTSSFLITTNFAEIATLVSSMAIGLPLPLLPTQILWLNLVTDGAVGFPLAAEPGHSDILKQPPRDKKENILSLEIIPFFILMTIIMALSTLFIFQLFFENGGLEKARTGAFTVMAFTQLFNSLNMRSIKNSVFKIGFFSNRYIIIALILAFILQIAVIEIPFFQNIFHFKSLSALEIIGIFALSSLVLWIGEIYKIINSKTLERKNN